MVELVRHRRTKGAETDMFEPKATASHLDSTEAYVRQNVAFWMGGGVFIISTRELLFRTGRADVSANGEWQRNAVGRHRTLLNRQSFCAGLFVGTRRPPPKKP